MKYFKVFIVIFLITFIFSKCNSKTSKEYFDDAIQKLKNKKYEEALKEFDWLVKKFPDDSIAAKSIFEIAKLYHAKLIPNLSKEESLKEAIKNYKKVFYNYRNMPEAEHGLFLAGFIFANELNNIDSAKYNYELFLKNYPNSTLIQSVKLELENLGIPPDEIINKKIHGLDATKN
ncbi:MAG: tetratricopeptide repeat protein [Melioribacter sp.]|nr:tetratricopeptide repeat protein [Melioribacter sp.]